MISRPCIFASSNITDGNMSFMWGDREDVLQNRQKFLGKQGIDLDQCVLMNVHRHSDDVLVVKSLDAGRGMTATNTAPEVDALITREGDVALALLTADCYPVVVFDTYKTILGLVHLGWLGVDQELLPKVIAQMCELGVTSASSLVVKIGPGGGADSYIKSNPKQLADTRWRNYITRLEGDKYKIDLQSFIVDQATDVGVKKANIEMSRVDTISNSDYFSHCRSVDNSEPEGRLLTVAKLA